MTRVIDRSILMLLALHTDPITYFWHPDTGNFYSHTRYDGRSAPDIESYCRLVLVKENPILKAYAAAGRYTPATEYPEAVWAEPF